MIISNKIRQPLVVKLIKAVQKYGKHTVSILGNTYTVSDKVFNPGYYFTSIFMAKNINLTSEDIVLDMGTGSGIQAVTAGKYASRVVAVDINPEAVHFAQENVKKNNMENIVSVIEGDLFNPLQKLKMFSVILFTPPYLDGRPETHFEHALFDPGKELIRRFFSEAKDYLINGGYVQMLYSSISDHEKALSIAAQLGWNHSLIFQQKTLTERFMIYKLTCR